MTILSSKVPDHGYSAQWDNRAHTYSTTWRIESNDIADGALSVYAGAIAGGGGDSPHPLPERNDVYKFPWAGHPSAETDSNSFARTFNFRRTEGDELYYWDVTVGFRPLQPGEHPGDHVQDPLVRPVIYWTEAWDSTEELYQAHLVTDLSPNLGVTKEPGDLSAFINSVGDPLADSIQVNKRLNVYCAQKNFSTADGVAQFNSTYANKRNNAPWGGFAAGAALCLGADGGQPLYDNGASFWPAVIRFLIDAENLHHIRLPNKGLRYNRVGDTGRPRYDQDPNTGLKFTQPQWLTLTGVLATEAQIGVSTHVEYEENNLISFAAIGV